MAVVFDDTIRSLRYSRRMTQAELANRLGITRTVISAYENGTRQPSHEVLIKMAGVFNVSLDYLYNYGNSQKVRHSLDLTGMERDHRILLEEMADIIRISESVTDCNK